MKQPKQLKTGDKVYRITKGGLITQISEILGTEGDLAMSGDYNFAKGYTHEKIRCVDLGKDLYHNFSIETKELKEKWFKQILIGEIIHQLDPNLRVWVLERILKLTKYIG